MELIDLVDINDNVIGVTDKPTAHAKKQIHRVAAVYVFNSAGQLYVQVHKSSGGLYDHSVGGHLSKGENYEAAAVREAEEELGILQPLTNHAVFYSDEGKYLHMFGLLSCVADKHWKFIPNEEVEEIIPMKIEEIVSQMKHRPHLFTHGFINTMQEYLKVKRRNDY